MVWTTSAIGPFCRVKTCSTAERTADWRAFACRVRADIGRPGGWTSPETLSSTAIGEVCRKAGISEATFYNWRKKYGGLMPSEMRRLKQLEEENGKLRKLVAWS